jgi:hypothetical protein
VIYARALALLARHPSLLAMPLFAAVFALLLERLGRLTTDPLGGLGAGLYVFAEQIAYGFAFAVAIIHASDLLRGRRASFDAAWDEGRRKAGGIVLAVIGFWFILYVAALAGATLAGPIGELLLQLVAAFFLIYTIPAAAIGGLPGSLALSASIRAVRVRPAWAIAPAVAFVALWIGLPLAVALWPGPSLGPFGYDLAVAIAHAIALAYMAFPFAHAYDEVAFRALW